MAAVAAQDFDAVEAEPAFRGRHLDLFPFELGLILRATKGTARLGADRRETCRIQSRYPRAFIREPMSYGLISGITTSWEYESVPHFASGVPDVLWGTRAENLRGTAGLGRVPEFPYRNWEVRERAARSSRSRFADGGESSYLPEERSLSMFSLRRLEPWSPMP